MGEIHPCFVVTRRIFNYLVLSGGAAASRPLPALVGARLGAPAANRLGALLYLFQTQPLSLGMFDTLRDAGDLYFEAQLQDYLNRFSLQDFLLVRVGGDRDSRGGWTWHPFQDHPSVLKLESSLTQDNPTT